MPPPTMLAVVFKEVVYSTTVIIAMLISSVKILFLNFGKDDRNIQ